MKGRRPAGPAPPATTRSVVAVVTGYYRAIVTRNYQKAFGYLAPAGASRHGGCGRGCPWLRSRLPALWSRSCLAASVGAVSAATVRRYIGTQYERPWRKERPR